MKNIYSVHSDFATILILSLMQSLGWSNQKLWSGLSHWVKWCLSPLVQYLKPEFLYPYPSKTRYLFHLSKASFGLRFKTCSIVLRPSFTFGELKVLPIIRSEASFRVEFLIIHSRLVVVVVVEKEKRVLLVVVVEVMEQ